MINPKTGSSLDAIDTFFQFGNESFPCTKADLVYGGLGSKFAVLERAMAAESAFTVNADSADTTGGLVWTPV